MPNRVQDQVDAVDAQMAKLEAREKMYPLERGRRYRILRDTTEGEWNVTITETYNDWIEFAPEDENGMLIRLNEPASVTHSTFLLSIIAELPSDPPAK